ncbi:RING finger protein [Cercophora scortea]|uniref:RING-type E3 ubiquitin transferase n=1 Tax=Cercophora scortea TaxID=314031 RepID=A0AAE0MJF4_9PEZI|nr:RING finger protein [Cercophora scortea]
MFTQPAPAPTSPGLGNPAASIVSALPSPSHSQSSSSRSSRIRALSYLRNYTQTHLLSREHNNSTSSNNSSNSSNSSTNGPTHNHHQNHTGNHQNHQHHHHLLHQPASPASTSSSLSPGHPPNPNPTRAIGSQPSAAALQSPTAAQDQDPPATTTPNPSSSSPRHNRFSLVPTLAHPLGLPPLPTSLLSPSTSTSASTPTPAARTQDSPARRLSDFAAAIPSIVTTAAAEGTTTPADNGRASLTLDNTMTRARSATTGDAKGNGVDILPSIRFSTFHDPRASRPSLTFTPISRTLPTGAEIIRVGRYSERDSQPNVPHNIPSAAPVGFKSKVVSRRHCEFWYEEGKWFIKDVKSSSGTFLNHIRLSPPGTESKPFPVNDGDIVQLGIDFKGGEEMIFRCVKMRLELNRGWQSKLNTFNMTTHKRLRNMTASSANSSAAQSYSQDCSICLNSIAPCQCLFVAPCSHTWHYKCIKALLSSPSYPIFICPNCRAAADLEAEVEDPEEWEQLDSEEEQRAQQESALLQVDTNMTLPPPRRSRESVRSARNAMPAPPSPPSPVTPEIDASGDVTMLLDPPPLTAAQADSSAGRPTISHTTSNPMPIPTSPAAAAAAAAAVQRANIAPNDGRRDTRTPSPTGAPVLNGTEGPITPRNDAGPWVFDGSGLRMRVDGAVEGAGGGGITRINSLEAAVSDEQL